MNRNTAATISVILICVGLAWLAMTAQARVERLTDERLVERLLQARCLDLREI